ncbi:hypothetical protein [Bosea sp. CS1GBMeth4]|uniref:hypothetical protein n=1 Tax=Bosea sp. CS1GBMeth4 TaxID=1892849 RepID=UPI001646C13A|nr:hypothetical protein [Bosea sp. CS1GBMeth4]
MRFGNGQSAAFAGRALHAYLDFVKRTTRFKPAIPGARPWERSREPFIALTWHGGSRAPRAGRSTSSPP